MVYLLDTSALLAHYRNEKGADKVQAILEDDSTTIMLACISLTEFCRRLHDLGAGDKEIKSVLSEYLLIIPDVKVIDTSTAMEAFEIGRKTPERIPLVDTIIAATAKLNSACLVHRDSHMGLIPKNILNQLNLDK